jgi:hypothetical protein
LKLEGACAVKGIKCARHGFPPAKAAAGQIYDLIGGTERRTSRGATSPRDERRSHGERGARQVNISQATIIIGVYPGFARGAPELGLERAAEHGSSEGRPFSQAQPVLP